MDIKVIPAEPGWLEIDLETGDVQAIIGWQVEVDFDYEVDTTTNVYPICAAGALSDWVSDPVGRVYHLNEGHRFNNLQNAQEWYQSNKKNESSSD